MKGSMHEGAGDDTQTLHRWSGKAIAPWFFGGAHVSAAAAIAFHPAAAASDAPAATLEAPRPWASRPANNQHKSVSH